MWKIKWTIVACALVVMWLYSTQSSLWAAGISCQSCHADLSKDFENTPHADHTGIEHKNTKGSSCSICHGDGAVHMASPGAGTIGTFSNTLDALSLEKQQAICTSCHSEVNSAKHSGSNSHSMAGVTCTSCHTIHSKKKIILNQNDPVSPGLENLGTGSASCVGCHTETLTQFSFNERHRLSKGGISCTSCHNPHNPHNPDQDMRAHSSNTKTCAQCHSKETSPYIYEHAASLIEGCGACHTPHGSPNRHMLVNQEVGALCYSCHADVPQFHLGFSPAGSPRFNERTLCTNCHATIHGSNLDRHFLR